MEEFLKNLSENLDPTLSFVLVMVMSILFFFKKDLGSMFIFVFKRGRKFKIKALLNHDVFSTCVRVKKEVELDLKFTFEDGNFDKTKTQMCRDFTSFKIEVCTEHFKRIANKDLDSFSPDRLKKYIMQEMNTMHENYIRAIKKHWSRKGVSRKDVEAIILLFEEFRYPVVLSFEKRINSVFASEFHADNFERVLAVFEIWSMGIDLLPRDLNQTFEKTFGEFQNVSY